MPSHTESASEAGNHKCDGCDLQVYVISPPSNVWHRRCRRLERRAGLMRKGGKIVRGEGHGEGEVDWDNGWIHSTYAEVLAGVKRQFNKSKEREGITCIMGCG